MTEQTDNSEKEKIIKQLNQVVCICNGIKLARVLKGLKGSKTVAEVNQKVGSGSGGCQGRRCGPRIKALLNKLNKVETQSTSQNHTSESQDPESEPET